MDKIMPRSHLCIKFTNIVVWIFFLNREQVGGYIHDILNPLKEDAWHERETRLAIQNDIPCERPNIYVCEEPPDTIAPETRKTCNYRNVRYHEQVYRWVAGRGCLLYTPDFLYAEGTNTVNLNAGCFYGNWFAPCLEIPKEDGTCGCYPFDPGLAEVAAVVRDALVPAAHGRWERCFYAAMDCCSHYMLVDVNTTDSDRCEATFDGWTCWQGTEGETTASAVCSEFAYSNVGPSCHHFSTKRCHGNGTWELQSDYSTCSITPRLVRRYYFHIAVLSISIVFCLPAIFIFCFYKRLRITRVALHRNLLIAIVMRNILVIVSRSVIYIDELTSQGETVMSTHGIACRVLAFAERVAANAVFVCMLVEGFYLHRLIVAVFKQKLKIKWLYCMGVVMAFAPAVAWASVMAVHNDHSCWLVYTIQHVQWILDAPRVFILLINTVLFVDVLRVLLTKIRNNENANQLSTAKATLFLMPLFGTQFLLTALRPNTTDCIWEQTYYYISYSLEGLQGFTVAMLYCYINKEVHTLIKATYKKTENAVVSRIRRDSEYPRTSAGQDPDRRITYTTSLPPPRDEISKRNHDSSKPKLHVAEIISIQASERLAEILDPMYETIHNGVTNSGYDSLERSDCDNDSGFIPNRDPRVEDYYGFTNASSVSIDCHDWIRCVSSPSSSVYNNSLNDYEARYLERKFPNHPKLRGITEDNENSFPRSPSDKNVTKRRSDSQTSDVLEEDQKPEDESVIKDGSDYEDCENMLDEILQFMEINDNNQKTLDADKLSPNRKDEDKVIFVEE